MKKQLPRDTTVNKFAPEINIRFESVVIWLSQIAPLWGEKPVMETQSWMLNLMRMNALTGDFGRNKKIWHMNIDNWNIEINQNEIVFFIFILLH